MQVRTILEPVVSGTRGLTRGWTRPFGLMLGSQVAHAAGNAMVAIALGNTLFFAVPLGAARGQLLLYLLITMLPFAFLSPVLGRLIDVSPRGSRRVLVWSSVGRVVVLLLAASRLDTWTLFPFVLAFLVLSRAYGATRVTVVPETLPPGRTLVWANTWMAVTTSVGGVVGAAAAVVCVRVGGSAATVVLAAIAFAAATALCILLPPVAAARLERSQRSERPDGGRGAAVAEVPVALRSAGTVTAVMRLLVGYITFFLAFVLKDRYSLVALGAVVLAAAIGGMLGAFTALALARLTSNWVVAAVMVVPAAAASTWAAIVLNVPTAIVLGFTVALSAAATRLAFDSELQASVDARLRGRVVVRYETTFQVAWVLGALLSVPPIGLTAGRALLFALVVLACAVAVRGAVAVRRHGSGAYGAQP